MDLASLYVLVEALMAAFFGALKGAGDTFWVMCFSITLHWVLVPVLFVMLKIFNCSPEAGWLTLVIIYFMSSGFVYLRYREGKWKRIKVVKKEITPIVVESFHEPIDL